MMRAGGHSYRELEATGILLVVTKMEIQYFLPAEFDDLLILTTRVTRSRGVRIHHEYEIKRDDAIVVTGQSEIACIHRDGSVKRLPDFLQSTKSTSPST